MTFEQLRQLQEDAALDLAYWARLAEDRRPFVSVDGEDTLEEIDFDPWEWA